MANLGLRIAGGLLAGAGNGILEAGKAKRQEMLMALERQYALEDRTRQENRQDARWDREDINRAEDSVRATISDSVKESGRRSDAITERVYNSSEKKSEREFDAGEKAKDRAAADRRARDAEQRSEAALNRPPSGYRRAADGNLEPVPGGPGELRNTAQGFQQENALRDEYQTRSKDFGIIQDARAKIKSVDDSPAGDLSRLYSYMKLLDPGSVVRESEFATAATARPLLERMGVSWDAVAGIWRGEKMTPSMRTNFLKEAENIYKSSEGQQRERETQYENLSREYGLDPKRVVTGIRTSAKSDDSSGGGQAQSTRIRSDADYDALPSGAEFTAPDGSRRRKP